MYFGLRTINFGDSYYVSMLDVMFFLNILLYMKLWALAAICHTAVRSASPAYILIFLRLLFIFSSVC
jgi:hypothetical protein